MFQEKNIHLWIQNKIDNCILAQLSIKIPTQIHLIKLIKIQEDLLLFHNQLNLFITLQFMVKFKLNKCKTFTNNLKVMKQ
jgi:hypothetical protein